MVVILNGQILRRAPQPVEEDCRAVRELVPIPCHVVEAETVNILDQARRQRSVAHVVVVSVIK